MSSEFSGINNIDRQYVKDVTATASEFLGGKKNISVKDAVSIFKQNDLHVNEAAIAKIAKHDGKDGLSVKEFASIFAMLDGKLQNGKFRFDGYVEDSSEEGFAPDLDIISEGTKSEKELVLRKFHEVGGKNPNINRVLDSLLRCNSPSDEIKFIKEQGWQKGANDILDEKGNLIGRIHVEYYEPEAGTRSPATCKYQIEQFE